jgi:hypothetical protein
MEPKLSITTNQPLRRYFIFAAGLVILMNQFSSLYHTEEYEETMRDAGTVMAYCAEMDPQAQRVLDIITRFSEVVTKWTKEHAYSAPQLSDDFSCLYNQPTRSGQTSEHASRPLAVNTTIQERRSSQGINRSDPGLLTPPSLPKLPLLDILSAQTPSAAALETRMSGVTPPHTHAHSNPLAGVRSSISAHSSSIASSEPLSGNIEFEFDGLWNNFITHLPPVSTVAQFPPPVIGTPTEPYGAYSTPVLRMLPPIQAHSSAPLFRAGFG